MGVKHRPISNPARNENFVSFIPPEPISFQIRQFIIQTSACRDGASSIQLTMMLRWRSVSAVSTALSIWMADNSRR